VQRVRFLICIFSIWKDESDQNLHSLLLTKESVVLYVGHDNPGAAKVYHRVGFLGLAGNADPVEGVDHWTEIGFDRTQVELGQW
jgi:hypothetical protein